MQHLIWLRLNRIFTGIITESQSKLCMLFLLNLDWLTRLQFQTWLFFFFYLVYFERFSNIETAFWGVKLLFELRKKHLLPNLSTENLLILGVKSSSCTLKWLWFSWKYKQKPVKFRVDKYRLVAWMHQNLTLVITVKDNKTIKTD